LQVNHFIIFLLFLILNKIITIIISYLIINS